LEQQLAAVYRWVNANDPVPLLPTEKMGFSHIGEERLLTSEDDGSTEPNPVQLRLIKYTINMEIYVCSTTLLDKQKYPLNEFPAVYHGR
jgi:hypothetical protein